MPMPSNNRLTSARAKIDRASKHISDVSETLRKKRPFRYILETDAKAGWRSVGPEKDDATVTEIALICGDAIHNLRSAIDHAYHAVVDPFAQTAGERKRIQFPVAETAARLEELAKNRLADRVSPEFFNMIIGLQAHGETGGNRMLYLIHTLDMPDKHASFVPTANNTKFTGKMIKRFAPDCPFSDDSYFSGSNNRWDMQWNCRPFTMVEWIVFGVPANGILKQEIDIPIEITFYSRDVYYPLPAVPTPHQFVDVTKSVVDLIARFA